MLSVTTAGMDCDQHTAHPVVPVVRWYIWGMENLEFIPLHLIQKGYNSFGLAPWMKELGYLYICICISNIMINMFHSITDTLHIIFFFACAVL